MLGGEHGGDSWGPEHSLWRATKPGGSFQLLPSPTLGSLDVPQPTVVKPLALLAFLGICQGTSPSNTGLAQYESRAF